MPLPLGNSSDLAVGESIVAIGNPFGLSNTMTSGIVSQLGRDLDAPGGYNIVDVIQLDAAINPGNSGGPLLNLRGEVVGINTAIVSESQGVGFAIPSDTVKRELPSLIQEGEYKHPWLGVSIYEVNPDLAEAIGLNYTWGVLIVSVTQGGPAINAGLKGGDRVITVRGEQVMVGGDVIIGIDDFQVKKLSDVSYYTERNKRPGDLMTLEIIRDDQKMNIPLVLGERPPP
jgi:S1-C subfamily serine protease